GHGMSPSPALVRGSAVRPAAAGAGGSSTLYYCRGPGFVSAPWNYSKEAKTSIANPTRSARKEDRGISRRRIAQVRSHQPFTDPPDGGCPLAGWGGRRVW